jgi:hypothetical protein
MDGACRTYGEKERCQQGLVENSAGKRPLERPRGRLEDNIEIDHQEVE